MPFIINVYYSNYVIKAIQYIKIGAYEYEIYSDS